MTRVLLVDDDPIVRSCLAFILADAGHTVATCDTAADALSWVETHGAPALLVTDVDLGPEPDGLALSTVLRGRHPDLPVLLISGLERGQGRRPLAVTERFLAKPFLPCEFLAVVRELTVGTPPT